MKNRINADKLIVISNQKILEKQYWLEQLSGLTEKSNFPFDFSGENIAIDRLETTISRFRDELFLQLDKLSGNNDIKLYMILAAGLVVLLKKYNTGNDITIGTPIYKQESDRDFINTVLVLRNRSEDTLSFKEILLQVRNSIRSAAEHQNYPVEYLAGHLNMRVRDNEYPFFDIGILLQNIHYKKYFGDIRYHMLFDFNREDGCLEMTVEYNPSLYRRSTVEQIIRHYMRVLETALADVDIPLSNIDMLSAEEKKQLLEEFNDTDMEVPEGVAFPRLFEREVEKSPANIAVIASGSPVETPRATSLQITYRQLNEKANQLAGLLRDKGVKPDSITAIMVGRSPGMIIAVIAVMKAGGAYLPVDPGYPPERIEFMLQDSRAPLLLTEEHLKESAPVDFHGEVISIEDKAIDAGSTANLTPVNRPTDLVYVIYTSGSTGRPKGVMVQHDNFLNAGLAWRKEYRLQEIEVCLLQVASFSFDVFAGDLARTFLNSGKMVINFAPVLDPDTLYNLISSYRITLFESTPSYIMPFLRYVCVNNLEAGIDSLKLLIFGSDVCLYRDFKEVVSRFGKRMRIVNSYGVTEATIDSSYYEVLPGEELPSSGVVPIGRPLPNVKFYILGPTGALLPIGAPGELFIGGKGIARGYLYREELTADRFNRSFWGSRDLFSKRSLAAGGILYRTGDRARWLPDPAARGAYIVEFLGRMDYQVKVRGYRIELGEIENSLLEHEDIKQVIVVEKGNESSDKYLCGYIISDKTIDPEALRRFLGKRLPDYMIPWFYVQMERFPLTPNGKIDRNALPEPETIREIPYAAPRDEMEIELVQIWAEILYVEKERIGIDTRFFDLGGNSLKAILSVARIHKAFDVTILLEDIFRIQTIRGIAEYIKESNKTRYLSIEKAEEKEYYALSSAQKRLYILQQLDSKNCVYNMPLILSLEGKSDKEKFAATFKKIIQRHESLRTSFEVISGEPVQEVRQEVELKLEYYDLAAKNAKGREEIEVVIKNFIRPFDLSQAPLLRVGLLKTTGKEFILMVDMHHIISDGVSSQVLMQDFSDLYSGKELPGISVQYKDYAEWQNREKATEKVLEQGEYWKKQFEGEIPVLELPIDYARPVAQAFEGSSINFQVDNETTGAVKALALKAGTTLYIVLLALYNILLSKLSSREDIVIGAPAAGRRHADLEKIIGMFVNTIVLRNYPSGEKKCTDFLEEVKEKTLKAFENQEYQYEDLVDEVVLTRDVSRNPLFDTMFVLQNTGAQKIDIPGLKLVPDAYEHKTSKFDLTLAAVEMEEKIQFTFEYCTKLFKRETVERFAAYFINIIQGVGANSQKRISAFEIITEEEKKRILVDFNNTETGYPGNTTVHRLFEEQAAETPDHVGLVGDVGQVGQIAITYSQLNEQSASVAGLLIEKGVLPDNIVAITMGRSVEMIVGIMGILKSGGAYLPIDPEYPQERIDYMLKDSGAEIIINRDFLVSAPRAPLHHSSFIDHHSNQLAYIIYTSGSTGNPKGVMVEHRSLVNLCRWHNSFYSVTWRDRATKYAGFGFDASVWEIFPYLAAGASLYIVPGEIILDIEGLNRYYEKNGITIVFLPTHVCEQFMELNNNSLRVLLTGGDKLKNYIKKNYRLYNNYGPTENTVVTTSFWVTEESGNIPIGKPIANNQVYILDRNNCLQPVGIPGELCVAGGGIARGYLNQPELTSNKFYRSYRSYKTYINYKTGDLARWLPDPAAPGAYIVEFLGRIDHQVKIRGFRIELGEIEAQLTNNTNIKEAAATVLAGEKGDKYLCAYFVSDKELRIPELRETLLKKLPDYMIPSYFVQLEKFPLTANGKIDRKALPEPGLKAGDSYIAPRDGIEEKLVLLWSEILGKDPLHASQLQTSIGIDDNFFESGGHSLRAMTLVSRIRKEFDVEFPLGNIFSEPTVQGMARFIKNTQKSIFEEIKPVEKRQYYPLSSAQKRLFFLAHVENIGASYNTPAVLNVKGKIDIPRFEHAIKDVIKRHEALRTSFHLIKNEPAQRIHDEVEFEIEYKNSSADYTDYPGEKDYISHFIRSFDLSRAPLLRVCLVTLAQDRLLLLYDMHHIIGDGTSSGVLIDDFIRLYAGENLQPLKIQYKDFSHWQNNLFENGRIKAQEDYWINLFRGDIPRLTLPTDYPRPVSFSFAGESFVFTLDSENTSRLKQLGLANGTTLYMNLLAAFNVLLYKYTGQDDIIVGGVIAGRRHADLQRIIGMFVNTLAMRNYPHGDKTFPGFLKEVKENSLNAFENQDVQFEELVAKLDVERDPSRNPLFDVCFVMQNAEQSQADLGKLERTEDVVFSPYEFENKISQFDLTVDAFENAGEIHFKLEYCTGLFNIETTRGLARHFLNIIGEIAAKQDSIPLLADIDIMAEEEKRQALVEFNDTDADYPADKTLHELFAEQASKTPDHIALVGTNSQGAFLKNLLIGPPRRGALDPQKTFYNLSYRQLNERSNRVAHYLRDEKNIRAGAPVGLIMDRSVDGVIAILGILKAGGAYVPIDPSLPRERIKNMINDPGINVVISQEKYNRPLNFLQWECNSFDSFLCIDGGNIDYEENEENDAEKELEEQAKLWEYVGESASDDITGGGWVSSYTGAPLSRLEMDEYGNNILEKLKPLLHKQMRVLEIGCASGISMFRIAPLVGFYHGTDLSRIIIEKNRERAVREGHANIALDCLPAHEIENLDERDFDLVIINSVIQDFPGHNYLRRVIRGAVGVLGERGRLFIGDVMDQDLKEKLIRDLAAFKRDNRDKNYKTKTDFSMDLFISRAFFNDLVFEIPGIRRVEFSGKIFTVENELTRYRYDALIEVDKVSPAGKAVMSRRKYRDDARTVETFPMENLPVRVPPHSLAYVLYTSGTTGGPKGVMVEHRGVVNLAHWFGRAYGLRAGVNLLQLTAYSFDPSVEDIFSTLLHGASLYVASRELLADMEKLRGFIRMHWIHIIDFIPALLEELLCGGEKLESLRAVISGGEKLEDSLKDRLLALGYRLYNHYGPTEVTVDALVSGCSRDKVTLGTPIANTRCFIRDRDNNPAVPGAAGELCIAGVGLARGYLDSPELTAEKFIKNRSYRSYKTNIIYKTGDLARWLSSGNIEFLGRIDQQVKIRGYRIELEEIRRRLVEHPNVKNAAVIDRQADNKESYLCAYMALLSKEPGVDEIKGYLSACLPSYMVPTRFVEVESIPLTPGGKIDRKALLSYSDITGDLSAGDGAPGTPIEKQVADAWKEVLQLENIGVNQNFFEIGGNSISILKVQGKLKKILDKDIPIVKLFKYPTIHDLARYLEEESGGASEELKLAGEIVRGKELLREKFSQGGGGGGGGDGEGGRLDIAVVGMAGVFPGAANVRQYWENLKNGVESIPFFTDEELLAASVSPQLLQDPNFVRAGTFFEGAEYFDAPFFSYTPREAAIMDPQIRVFHQCAWHALEDAGYDPYSYSRRIGLYAGSSPNLNWEILALCSGLGAGFGAGADWFQVGQLSDKDFLCSRVSYRLNLKGPSFSIQTACSTSLVAVHLAVQGLLDGDCEMALAGGVTISYPAQKGYLYQPGLVQSPDGHCRAFDVMANGTAAGNGAAVVVLKRLEEAQRDNDYIHGVIKGAAINNDGFRKVSYSAPSVEGQAEVIRAAQVMAGVHPETISYIEAHGTGTELGDPVEIEALKLAFNTRKRHFCGVGSVKTNIGHLDTAAGAAGLIKTILALEHRLIPPSLHFNSPNPKLDLEHSPFYVVSQLTPWSTADNQPRRAGVSSLGIGGTNAHVIVEEAPPGSNIKPRPGNGKHRLIPLSARTLTGLDQAARDLVTYLENNSHIDFTNMAYTLQAGRRAFEYRKMTVCPGIAATVENLSSNEPGKALAAFCPGLFPGKIIFLFPGQGSQYVNMGLGLYKTQPVFRDEMDRCFKILNPLADYDIKQILYPSLEDYRSDRTDRTDIIDQTRIAQPLLFSIQYALSKLLLHWGIVPDAMMGHSIGEYTAAHLAGVFSLEDALKLVAARGRLMQGLPPGAMLGVPLSQEELTPLLLMEEYRDISIAAVNNTSRCVVSGPSEAVNAFESYLKEKGRDTRRIHTSHAFHSKMMDPILKEFEGEVRRIPLSKPTIPYISNLSGDRINEGEVMTPSYWSRHLRGTVRFSRGLERLMKEDNVIFIEVGPGRTLSAMVNRHEAKKTGHAGVTLMRHPGEDIPDDLFLLKGVGQLWLYGVDIHWPNLYTEEKISRISLPGYPFEKKRFRLDESLFGKAVNMLTGFNVTPAAQAWVPGAVNECAAPGETGPSPGLLLQEFEPPRNEFEKKIALIWQEVLGFEQVGIYHNFFDLNGDSLSATQVISRVRDTFQVEVPLKEFFAEATVAQLAQKVKTLLVERIKNLSPEEKKKLAGG